MAIAKEDIKPGHYWVSDRKRDGELSIVSVAKWQVGVVVLHHGFEGEDELADFLDRYDFVARIEPPECV